MQHKFNFRKPTWYIVSKNHCGITRTPPEPNTFSFTILQTPSTPTVQDKDLCALSGVEISWEGITGANGYNLRVARTKIIQDVTSPYTYEQGNSNPNSYEIRAKNSLCTTSWSTSNPGVDTDGTPSTPSITSIGDVDPCAQSAIKIYHNPGSPATRYDLYRNGKKVIENYTSGDRYNPGSTSSFNYLIWKWGKIRKGI